MKRFQYRQGDVLLIPISSDEVPATAAPVARENGKAILAHGEVTGHHHAVLDRDVDLVGIPADGEQLVTADQATELYLLVHGAEAVALVHQEHDTISVDPGAYKVVRQKEYSPEEVRRVAD